MVKTSHALQGTGGLAYQWGAVSPGWAELPRRLLAALRKKYCPPCLSLQAGSLIAEKRGDHWSLLYHLWMNSWIMVANVLIFPLTEKSFWIVTQG